MSRDAVDALIAAGPVAIDGGLATHLEALGADISGPLWSARVLADDPGLIVTAHRDFIAAGARVVISASYQVSRAGFVAQGRSVNEADAALRRSVEVAREAVAEQPTASSGVLVAASIGPYGAITHDGGEYRGRYGLSHSQLVDFHGERIEILAQAGPDLLAVETIPDADEAAALAEVLRDYPDLPSWVTFSCGDDQRTWAGQPIAEGVEAVASARSVVAIGVNCVAPHLVTGLLDRLAAATELPLVAYPNAGRVWLPETETWTDSPQPEATAGPDWPVRAWAASGARLIGGCCCVEPAQIAGLALELTEC